MASYRNVQFTIRIKRHRSALPSQSINHPPNQANIPNDKPLNIYALPKVSTAFCWHILKQS